MFMLSLQGWCPWCGMHRGWGAAGIMALFWLLLLAAIIWIVLVFARQRGAGAGPPSGDRAEAHLRERYARGEIDEAKYRQMLEELRRS